MDEYQKFTMVRVAEFVSWAEGCRWKLPPEFPRPVETVATQPEAPRPVPRLRAQEEQILAALTGQGFDPLKLPAYPAGKESAAKQSTKAVVKMTDTVFAKAWGRLSAAGRIRHR